MLNLSLLVRPQSKRPCTTPAKPNGATLDQSKVALRRPTIKLTEAQIFEYGAELRRIMASPAFEAAVSIQQDHYKSQFFSSKYGDEGAREQAYRMNVALEDLLNSMSAFIVQASAMVAEADEVDDIE